MHRQDRYRGCLVGGGAGDALGYAVEFIGEAAIFSRYGDGGIRAYRLTDGVAQISDDTQMTLFTAAGLLLPGEDKVQNVWDCYGEWYMTQFHAFGAAGKNRSGLMDVQALWSPRAPGRTCLAAISGGKPGSTKHPINHSKGCGGVMRAAPAGLISPENPMNAAILGAETSALTHSHDLGWLPGAMLGHMVAQLVSVENLPIEEAARNALFALTYEYANAPDLRAFLDLMERAIELAHADTPELDAIHALGEGWVGDEAMAIALYCAIRHENDFAAGIIAAVNHKGDSDSTGAIAGNLLGAKLGYEAIPDEFKDHLELHELLLSMADKLYEQTGGNLT